MGRAAPLTHFSSPARSSQEPALTLKKNPEDKLDQGLLEARSEVSGCLFFLLNISFLMKRVRTFPLPGIFTQRVPLPHSQSGGPFSLPGDALGRGTALAGESPGVPLKCLFSPDSAHLVSHLPRTCLPSTIPGALRTDFSGSRASR